MSTVEAGPLVLTGGRASAPLPRPENAFLPHADGRPRILIATDAWLPQVNGVVRTLRQLGRNLESWGFDVRFITPDAFQTMAMPSYPEIRLAMFAGRAASRIIDTFKPQSIHIATEGPIGLAVRRHCVARGIPFTTSFHTMFPEYIEARTLIPSSWTYPLLRRFHNRARAIMVATATLERDLMQKGFRQLKRWSRGVDVTQFRPGSKDFLNLPRPVYLYVGRVAVEKNIEAFLKLQLPGSKLVVGDGPQLADLRQRYPDAHFAGARFGDDLARHYAASDVFVFPSRTDTFGLVMLEALASGLPVAAFPVQGPVDVVGQAPDAGVLHDDLREACLRAAALDPVSCRNHALGFSWDACARQFLSNLAWRSQPSLVP